MTLSTLEALRRVLEESVTVAVVGAHSEVERAAFYVPDYLHQRGYHIIPVNPRLKGTTLFGEPVRASLREVDGAIDLVDVFRRSEQIPEVVDDILAMPIAPKVVWLQLGIRNDDAAARLEAAGIEVVQDRCAMAEHRALGIPSKT